MFDVGSNSNWDSHGNMEDHRKLARNTDQPIAALIRDLKQRGMLDETLMVGCTEFGRTPWQDKNPKGFNYKDKAGTADGVQKGQLKTGAAGKPKAQIKAKGSNLPTPVPISASGFFDQDTTVTVQLVNDETATCLESVFTSFKKNTGDQFKAKAP